MLDNAANLQIILLSHFNQFQRQKLAKIIDFPYPIQVYDPEGHLYLSIKQCLIVQSYHPEMTQAIHI